jgi:threonine synthase
MSDILWVSCRDEGPEIVTCTFKEACLHGWAPDGGMYLPTRIPVVEVEELESWRGLSYQALCATVLAKWMPAGAIPPATLRSLVDSACARFAVEEVVRLVPLKKTKEKDQQKEQQCQREQDEEQQQLHVLELFHGPTMAFKDLGMCVLAEVMHWFLEQDAQRLTLLVGTSGDTGPSALWAFRGKPRVDVVVLYPVGRVSSVQEGQMLQAGHRCRGRGSDDEEGGSGERERGGVFGDSSSSSSSSSSSGDGGGGVGGGGGNGYVIGCEGTSDDLDVPCEAVLRDAAFKQRHCLGTVNSVNIVRMLVQTVHFFYAYLRLVHKSTGDDDKEGGKVGPEEEESEEEEEEEEAEEEEEGAAKKKRKTTATVATGTTRLLDPRVAFSIPCGAGGHLFAGILALRMGLPASALLVATNANDVLHRMVSEGVLQKRAKGCHATASTAMDIQVRKKKRKKKKKLTLLQVCTKTNPCIHSYFEHSLVD